MAMSNLSLNGDVEYIYMYVVEKDSELHISQYQ